MGFRDDAYVSIPLLRSQCDWYSVYLKYSDRHSIKDLTKQFRPISDAAELWHLIWVFTVCHSAVSSKMDLYQQFQDKYGEEYRCPNI